MQLKRQIPNIITLLNLLCGCIATIFAVQDVLGVAAFFVFLGIFFDFFDGFAARTLKVQSELGLQLDSLADMVTSGLVPGVAMYQLLNDVFPKPILAFICYTCNKKIVVWMGEKLSLPLTCLTASPSLTNLVTHNAHAWLVGGRLNLHGSITKDFVPSPFLTTFTSKEILTIAFCSKCSMENEMLKKIRKKAKMKTFRASRDKQLGG